MPACQLVLCNVQLYALADHRLHTSLAQAIASGLMPALCHGASVDRVEMGSTQSTYASCAHTCNHAEKLHRRTVSSRLLPQFSLRAAAL
jgi:hypothetical protein